MKYEVVELLKKGKKIGLVTDQGSPIISDPGFNVVNEVIKNNLSVIGLPGATAFVPALISSGIFPSKFLFYGFLNAKDAKQVQELKTLQYFPYTLIFYEAPHRIKNTLNNMYQVFGDRKICLARELSKLYEEYIRGTISEVVEQVDSIKGEIVLIVEGNTQKVDYNDLDILEHVNLYIEDGLTEKDAIKKVAKERNVVKSIIYKEYHTRK